MAAFGDVRSHPETLLRQNYHNYEKLLYAWVRQQKYPYESHVSIPVLLRCAWAANRIEQKSTSSERTNHDVNSGEVYSNSCHFHEPFWANLPNVNQKTYLHILTIWKLFKKNSIHTLECTTTSTKWELRYFFLPILRWQRQLRSVTNHVLWVPRQPHSATSKDTVWFMNWGKISFWVMRGEGTKWRLDYAVKPATVPKACSWEERCERILI